MTGVQTCALPISVPNAQDGGTDVRRTSERADDGPAATARVQPGAAPALARPHPHSRLYRQLKIVCVPILSAARQPSSAAATASLVRLLGDLSRALSAVPSAVFSPALANYVFFPLSCVMQPPLDGSDRGEVVLEATMGALATLVVRWRRAGIEMRILHELWIMTALKLGDRKSVV